MISIDNNKKGIYKDLYKAINTENKKTEKAETFSARMPKGIYRDIYRNIEKSSVSVEKADIWHKYPLKLLVYSNDFGEAVRPIVGGMMAKLSWLPAILYTLFAVKSGEKKEDRVKELAFQAIASFLIPFLLLKAVRGGVSKAIDKMPSELKNKIKERIARVSILDRFVNKFKKQNYSGHRNLALSAGGLMTLAFAVRPIDNQVQKLMAKHYRDV